MTGIINRKTLREETLDIIRKKILLGEIMQGDRIKEADMALELGVSRGPIREAFRQLEQEGLITYSAHKGCKVKQFTVDDVWEVYYLRNNLETMAVKLCNGVYSDEEINKMEAAIVKMAECIKAGDTYGAIKSDHDFHSSVVLGPKRKRLFELWNSFTGINVAIYYSTVNSQIVSIESQDEHHGRILDIIKTGDCEKICKTLNDHYMGTIKRMNELKVETISCKNQ
ncbi:GntR family transcriptional regulator [Alkaliphilus peptidifermentans]|uniref:DNA-binding transcriptional regulator, GntR family n=1 Tax=Alkaliphilus peptidifermentans DSM 18978 TaxID=1120976 RepID=A0A1G5L3R9_9FIRM|nr:GntR family transcriptional regulator [Alkaliphilus peptidifermentans]SCZ06829.1 DNA-binding transcriptional regulator, GntR family [Alkaliphilus peptidifermentans DSM 18978]